MVTREVVRHRRARLRRLGLLVVLWCGGVAVRDGVEAQVTASVRLEDALIGTAPERYLRALETLYGKPFDGRDTVWRGPWTIDLAPRHISLRSASIDVSRNSGLPYGRDDGSAWAGRGWNIRATGQASVRYGPVSIRLAPLAWWAQNQPFALLPAGPLPLVHPQIGYGIDLPQRMGYSAVGRVDPGESEVALSWLGARLALTSATMRIGAGAEHATLVQGEAGGYPRLEAGVPAGIRTPLGTISGNVAWGRLAQSMWAPNRRTGARLGTHLEARWRSPGRGLVEVGAGRFYHFDWRGFSTRDLGKPFGSLFVDRQVYFGGEPDNQQLSVFGRLLVPEAGLEIAAELAKNDRSNDLRDFGNELEHNAAWLVAVRRAWRIEERLWVVNVTAASNRIPELQLYRGQALNYEHSPLTQGHTLRGQLLGTPLLERGAGVEVRMDRYEPAGRWALIATSRSLPDVREEAIRDSALRHEWAVLAEWMRWVPGGAVTVRTGGLVEVAPSAPSGNRLNWHTAVGYQWRW